MSRTPLSRRRFLGATGAWAGLAALRGIAAKGSVAKAQVTLTEPLFTLGVASGDPTAHSVVLWTRLAPDPLNGGGVEPMPIPVAWEVARDAGLQDVMQRGVAMARPEFGHTVHAAVGELMALGRCRWVADSPVQHGCVGRLSSGS